MDIRDESRRSYHEFSGNVRDTTEDITRAGRDYTIKEFSRLGKALHSAAGELHVNNDYFAGMVDTLADKVDNFSHFIEEREPGDIIHSVQTFARHNPYFTIGGMFIAGLAVSRFLKTGREEELRSREEHYESDK
jgi:hypothetical protein